MKQALKSIARIMFFIGAGFTLVSLAGIAAQRSTIHKLRKSAIDAGAAHWEVSKYGDPAFVWGPGYDSTVVKHGIYESAVKSTSEFFNGDGATTGGLVTVQQVGEVEYEDDGQ